MGRGFFFLAALFFALANLTAACGASDGPKKTSPQAPSGPDASKIPGAWLTANGSYEVLLEWESGPQTGINNAAKINTTPRSDFATLPLQKITVTPWMTVHGHGSGNVQPIVEPLLFLGSGVYRVSNIFFVMSGPWDLKISLTDGTTSDTVVIPVEVPSA